MNGRMNLAFRAIAKYTAGAVIMGVMLFLPAGTIHYAAGWRFLLVLFGPMVLLGLVLLLKAPELLEKRLNHKEKESAQKQVISLSVMQFTAMFILAGLDYRLGWSDMPDWVSWLAAGILLVSYGLYGEVMRENAWLSRTVEVQDGQKVVDTGMYGVVRHPMYAVTIWLFLSMPLVLGSIHAFLLFLVYPLLLVKRIRNEEELLERELPGYREYKQRVKYKILPFVW